MLTRASDGCALYYEVRGEGPPLVLISGFGGTAGYWEPQLAALQERYSVVLLDQRGTGRSEARPVTSLDQLTDDVVAVLDACGIEAAHVIGHSLGGSIALRLAARYADRVAGLIVYAARTQGDPLREKIFALRRAIFRQLGPAAHASFTSLLLFPPSFITEHPQVVEAIETQSVAKPPDAAVFESRVNVVLSNDNAGDLESIRAKTLVLCARDDLLTPPGCSEDIAAGIRGSTLRIIESGGHAASRANAAQFNKVVLEFLAALNPTASRFSQKARNS
jgi:aminoacrylate hydrolase